MANSYQDLHRYFLQWIMTQRLATERSAHSMYQKASEIYSVQYGPDEFQRCLALINQKLKPLSMEIRKGKSEEDGVTHYAFVNCFEDEYSLVATNFTANEINFFKKVLDSVILSDEGHIPSMALINLGTDLPSKINADIAELLLIKLIEEKWLTETEGAISLGPRTVIELSVYLKNIYNEDISDCKLCMDIVIKGQACTNCGIKVHLYCSKKYFKDRHLNTRKCPVCQADWLYALPMIVREQDELD